MQEELTEQDHKDHDATAERQIIHDVEKYGCHFALIEADDYLPGFAYSIGLFKTYQHPEIICFGLNKDVLWAVVQHAGELIRSGESLVPNRLYSGFLEGYDVQFLPVERTFYPNYLGYAGWFYDWGNFPVLQLVWPDKAHKFPWESGFNPNWKFKQPLLDRNTDFKFCEERTLGVYTTKQVFAGDPILYVYHNEDGDWQFHSTDEPKLADAMLVCLEQITELDPTVNEIFHLQYGWNAWRSGPGEKWEYAEGEEDVTQNEDSSPD